MGNADSPGLNGNDAIPAHRLHAPPGTTCQHCRLDSEAQTGTPGQTDDSANRYGTPAERATLFISVGSASVTFILAFDLGAFSSVISPGPPRSPSERSS